MSSSPRRAESANRIPLDSGGFKPAVRARVPSLRVAHRPFDRSTWMKLGQPLILIGMTVLWVQRLF
jgi:hypothetical protein